MARGLGRLPFLGRRSARSGAPAEMRSAATGRPDDPDAAPVGLPVLLPNAIIREVLFQSTEFTPDWARPRPTPPASGPEAPAVGPRKRPRRTASDTAEARTAPLSGVTRPAAPGARPRRRKSTGEG